MELKRLKPITPSQRNLILLKNNLICKAPLLKKEIFKIKKVTGRNNKGNLLFVIKVEGILKIIEKLIF